MGSPRVDRRVRRHAQRRRSSILDPRTARPGPAFKTVAKLSDLKVDVPFQATIREIDPTPGRCTPTTSWAESGVDPPRER